MPTIKSDLGEQSFQGRPIRTFEVPDASNEEFAPLPGSLSQEYFPNEGLGAPAVLPRNQNYPNAEPVGAFNARQLASRQPMTFEDVKRAEEAMKAAKTAKFAPSRLSAAAKKRIAIICGISRDNRSVVIDGETYVLQILKGHETRASYLAASAFDGTIESPFEIRKQLLARSLCSIAGTDIDLFLGDDSLESKLAMIDELPESLLVKLMDEYTKLTDEVQARYFPKSEAEVAEVIEDLKK
jgi:hypothetical protein